MENILDYCLEELEEKLLSIGEKKYRATQIFEWVYRARIFDFDLMTNISKKSIEVLKENFYIEGLSLERVQVSKDGTRKYLFKLADSSFIETVLMKQSYGLSLCVSSEVGCNMGCAFCASGLLKLKRRLTHAEMVGQVLCVQKMLDEEDLKISNVVVMGIGEPFDNYDVLVKFLKTINYGRGLEIGARHITVSTCGLVPKIYEFASLGLQINLAISLHAANDELRSKLMPINKAYPLEVLIDALKEYFAKTNRRLTFEYILLKGINDSKKDALELSNLIKGLNAYVNLIYYNETPYSHFLASSHEAAETFFSILKQEGIDATIRMRHGDDIDAACGQLRAKVEEH